MRGRLAPALLAAACLAGAAVPVAAQAAPTNDDAPAADGFRAITAENGRPNEREAIAEPREATPDAGVPRCLGSASFARTVWFRIPAADAARELAVEASGRTADVLDLAAFVQPEGARPERPLTVEPNACAGLGAGGADASEEPAAGMVLRVPARRSVLVQVGRRGEPGSEEDERAVLSLAARDLPAGPAPAGDRADGGTPALPEGGPQPLALGGATLTEEDPAQPPCPSLGSVWRRFVPAASGTLAVVAGGTEAATLTVFTGDRPAGDNVAGCVNRERSRGELALDVPVQAGVPVWVRVGTDRPPADASGTLRIAGAGTPGPGGGPGAPRGGAGPRGGAAARCVPAARRSLARQRIAFRRRPSRPGRQNRYRTFPVRLGPVRVRLCAARVALIGPRGRTYARGTLSRVSGRRPSFRLRRVRRFVRGTYRLRVTALSAPGDRRVRIRTTGRARFR